MPALLYNLPQNFLRIFSGRNLLWHALAIVLTIVIVTTDTDWAYYQATRGMTIQRLALPAIIIGSLLPIWLPLILLVAGLVARRRALITHAWALGQAAMLGWFVACIYKAFTGREHPPFELRSVLSAATADPVNSSHGFHFGFMRGGVFWGWPSSHTCVAFATMVCLARLHPKHKPMVCVALLYALYVGMGVSVSIHWLSEFVAGAIIGSVIGVVVGNSFAARFSNLGVKV
jgi:PAP2 superfamily